MSDAVKKVKDPATENQKVIDNHKKAATHHQAAASHHNEAAKHFQGGNKDLGLGFSMKARGQSKMAKKLQKKNLKKYDTSQK